MLNLDQIKQLETKVSKAIQLIQSLKEDNDLLKLELHDRQKRIDELENIVLVFKNDQAKIEEGIINALNHLSAFEDTVYQAANTTAVLSTEQQQPVQDAVVPAHTGQSVATVEQEGGQQSASTEHSTGVNQIEQQEPVNDSDQMEIF